MNPKDEAARTRVPLWLIPPAAKIYIARVFELGARKYGLYNWRKTRVARSVYICAAHRHLDALLDGQDLDPESGMPHEAHVAACMAIMLDARDLGKLVDDRPPPGKGPELLKTVNLKASQIPEAPARRTRGPQEDVDPPAQEPLLSPQQIPAHLALAWEREAEREPRS